MTKENQSGFGDTQQHVTTSPENENVASHGAPNFKYCENCGAKIDVNAVVCPKCGVPVNHKKTDNPDDQNNGWWNFLGFLFPVIGWILWGVWHKEYPKRAHGICKWSWIGFGVAFLIGFLSAL